MHVQHLILTTIQDRLEKACFEHFKRNAPSVLEKQNLECASAAELSKWVLLLKQQKISSIGCSEEALSSAIKIRHSAVHRERTEVKALVGLLRFASEFASSLQDASLAAQIHRLKAEVESETKQSDARSRKLHSTSCKELLDIRQKQEKLNREEEELLQKMKEEKAAIRSSMSESLLNVVGKTFCSNQKPVQREEGDVEDEVWVDCQTTWSAN